MRPLEAPSRLREQQLGFAAHLRDPQHAPAPAGIEDRRLSIYRELFYNTVEGLLATNFPVLRTLRGDTTWHSLIRDFYREHRCHTPLFPELGREFLRYLEQRQTDGRGDPAFLLELAHYEWVELAMSLDDSDLGELECRPDGDLMAGVPLLSPLAWPLAYRFPVQQIRPDFQPEQPPQQATFLLVVRDRQFDIQFKAIDAPGFRLLQLLADNDGSSGRELLLQLAGEIGHVDPSAFLASGAQMLEQLRRREVILGTRSS